MYGPRFLKGGAMIVRLCKLLIFTLVLFTAIPQVFGEGEWEDPDNAPKSENDNAVPEAEIEEPEESRLEETEPREAASGIEDIAAEPDEPELEPPKDTFPIVHADAAAQPRPRNPGRILRSVDAADLTEKLDADRLLLSEIRKDVPEAREEAELYLIRLKELAAKSDPVRLVPLFDRVLDQAPIYFKWLETEYENQDEQITEYYVGGARGFAFAMDNFRSAVFLVIMNRLDIASRVISELD